MFRRVSKDNIFFSNQATNGTSSLTALVSDFRNCVVRVVSGGSFKGSVLIAGAIGETKPTINWGRANIHNPFDYLEVVDLNDGTAYDGDEGIEIRSANEVRQFEVNINAVDWLSVLVTSRAAGTVSVSATFTTNS